MIKGNKSLVENFNFFFLTPLIQNFKMLHFDANPLQLDIWLQSYEGFDNVKNNIKQRNLNTVFANISKTTSPTSDSFFLIMSHLWSYSLFVMQAHTNHQIERWKKHRTERWRMLQPRNLHSLWCRQWQTVHRTLAWYDSHVQGLCWQTAASDSDVSERLHLCIQCVAIFVYVNYNFTNLNFTIFKLIFPKI